MTGRRPATADEMKALANPLRLRILRLCLDEALTNKQLADGLGRDPGTVLHHVRILERAGFLAAEPVRSGARGALERPYRSTGKSWTLELEGEAGRLAMIDAFRQELEEAREAEVMQLARVGARLRAADLRELRDRLEAIVTEFKERDDARGVPVGLFVGLHRRRGPRGKRPRPAQS